MSLRFKLLLIALSTLALPLAGWLFVRQMEELLRHGQEQTLIASARALSRSLGALKSELPAPGAALYVHAAPSMISIDGFADDWGKLQAYAQDLGPLDNVQKVKLILCEDADWLYLLASVRDTTLNRADARDADALQKDHLTLTLQSADTSRSYLLASAAPGTFDARTMGESSDPSLPSNLTGAWQEDSTGYRVELRMSRSRMPERLGLTVYDAAAPLPEIADVRHLLTRSAELSSQLGQFAPEGMRVRLLSGEGWVVAESGKLDDGGDGHASRRRWFENLIYRSLIAPGLTQAHDFATGQPRMAAQEVWQALSGIAATAWHPAASDDQVVLAAAVPLLVNGEVRGALLLEQSGDALPLLTNRALLLLVGASLFALLFAGGVLFAFASVLGLRIRRLRNAADRAVRSGGRLSTPLPLIDARDELGDLSRSFARLLDEVAAYTDYLRTLASTLSHELQTPLAIVKSSLDNLDHQAVPAAAQTYLDRARGGAERLGAIVRAMSEASRMERAIAGVEGEDFDLAAVLRGCVEAYAALAVPRRVEGDIPDTPILMHGAPELIAQLLDKLFDNARGFTPEDGWIRLSLRAHAEGAEIRVANSGPLLPPAMQERVFDSLVSMRDNANRARTDAPHLGLGLYVVRMIAELHRGEAHAHNLADNSGVEFVLVLRGIPRRSLAGS